jgi:NitT/TauT family transport system substrate-binding protein
VNQPTLRIEPGNCPILAQPIGIILMVRYLRILATVLVAAAMVSACSRADRTTGAESVPAADQGPAAQLRLGYFPNITHTPALIGVAQGYFAKELGSTKLITQQFNAGPPEVSALLGGSLDAVFVGSSPAINAFAESHGQTVRLIAGSTSGGAQLVVKPGISAPDQLKGQVVADPQLGNTQDVSLKKWLKGNNLPIGKGPDAVTVQNLANPRILDLYKSGGIVGAWLPEPWSSQLVVAGGATTLVDEKSLWPNGQFPTTVLIVRTDFLRQHPATVDALLRGEQQAIDFINGNLAQAKTITNTTIKQLTGATLSQAALDRAFSELSFSPDPLASTYPQLARDSVTAGVTSTVTPLNGFLDVTELNKVLQAAGKPAVNAAGLDKAQG